MLPGADVSGKTLLLIDDIVTTGATLSECCRVLKGAGAARVDCAAFASPRMKTKGETPMTSRDIGIDLGTANILVYEEGKGIVLREPSVVAVDKNTGKVLQVGAAARNMLGRTPGNIVAVRPLRDGVISDYEMTEKMLDQFLKKISKFSLIKPRVIVCVPSGVTEVRRARGHSGDDGSRRAPACI